MTRLKHYIQEEPSDEELDKILKEAYDVMKSGKVKNVKKISTYKPSLSNSSIDL